METRRTRGRQHGPSEGSSVYQIAICHRIAKNWINGEITRFLSVTRLIVSCRETKVLCVNRLQFFFSLTYRCRNVGTFGGKVIYSSIYESRWDGRAKGRDAFISSRTAQTTPRVQTRRTIAGGRLRRCGVDVSHLWEITLWHAVRLSSTCLTTHFHIYAVALHNPRAHSSACTSRCVPALQGARDSSAEPRNKILLESNGLSAPRRTIVNAASLALGNRLLDGPRMVR